MTSSTTKQAPRLHVTGTVLGYQRGIHTQHPNRSLVQIENVNNKKDAEFYLGKRVAFVYRVKASNKNESQSNKRAIWGTITKLHGNSGVVRVNFKRNLPGSAFGNPVRIVS